MATVEPHGPPLSERLTLANIEHAFTYQTWNEDQARQGREVTSALIAAAKAVLMNVPECPMRTRALNNLVDARMIANAAITHSGLY